MKKLHISDDLSLPLDAATQTFAFIARKGAGKTYAAGKLTEELLDAGVQVVVLDTVGNWYGLRIDANGKDKGFDIPVIGGLRGDLPLQETAGELIADVIVDTGRSMVLDLSQFSLSARKRFATAFGERLWKNKKAEKHPTPLMLLIEESQLIIPQMVSGGDTARMVGIYEEIGRLGRNYGIGLGMLSQRPQSVNKEVLNQTECLFVGQVNGAQERKALKEWIVHQGMDVALLDELPSLPIGTHYVWSPQWLGILQKVKIAKKKTFDASATPKVGDKQVRRNPAPLDLGELQTKMAATIEQAKKNDPAELRKQLHEAKAALHRAGLAVNDAKQSAKVKTVEVKVPVLSPALEKKINDIWELRDAMQRHLITSGDVMREVQNALERFRRPTTAVIPSRNNRTAPVIPPARATVQTSTTPSGNIPPGDGELSGGARRMLIALAQRPQGMSAKQLGVRAGMSSTSGTFGTYLGRLRTLNAVEGDRNLLRITESGLAALGEFEPLPSGQALFAYWLNEVGSQSGIGRMLTVLANAYPNALSDEEIGQQAGISPSSGTFGTYLGKLRTLELVEGTRSALKASAELFEE